jgi:hypothetical protein
MVDRSLGLRPLGSLALAGLWMLLVWLVPVFRDRTARRGRRRRRVVVLAAALGAFFFSLGGYTAKCEERASAIHEWPIDERTWAWVIGIATSVVAITAGRVVVNTLGL